MMVQIPIEKLEAMRRPEDVERAWQRFLDDNENIHLRGAVELAQTDERAERVVRMARLAFAAGWMSGLLNVVSVGEVQS